MIFKKEELKLLWPFYLATFLLGSSMLMAPFLIIYLRNLGFSFLKIEIMFSVMLIAVFFFEIPTGAFADIYGRKFSTILGIFLIGVASTLIYFIDEFFLFMLCWILFGIAGTFTSGADEAWVVDYLKFHKRKDLIQDYYVKMGSIAGIALVISPLISGLLVEIYSIRILWLIMAAIIFLSALVLWIFTCEHFKRKRIKIKDSFKETAKISKKSAIYSAKHPRLFILILAIIFGHLIRLGFDAWQPTLVNLGMPTPQLGYVFSLMGLICVFAPFLSSYITQKIKTKNALAVLAGLEAIFYISMILIYPPLFYYAAVIFILANGFLGIRKPIESAYMQKFIPSKIRASVTSVVSMVKGIVLAIFSLGAGYLMDILGPKIVITIGGLFGIPAVILYLRIKK